MRIIKKRRLDPSYRKVLTQYQVRTQAEVDTARQRQALAFIDYVDTQVPAGQFLYYVEFQQGATPTSRDLLYDVQVLRPDVRRRVIHTHIGIKGGGTSGTYRLVVPCPLDLTNQHVMGGDWGQDGGGSGVFFDSLYGARAASLTFCFIFTRDPAFRTKVEGSRLGIGEPDVLETDLYVYYCGADLCDNLLRHGQGLCGVEPLNHDLEEYYEIDFSIDDPVVPLRAMIPPSDPANQLQVA